MKTSNSNRACGNRGYFRKSNPRRNIRRGKRTDFLWKPPRQSAKSRKKFSPGSKPAVLSTGVHRVAQEKPAANSARAREV